jgi:hypothetical protein
MNLKTFWVLLLFLFAARHQSLAQLSDSEKDSIYIDYIENQKTPAKILHAEPLYIDLIRDLGARKGEKEWNFGLGLSDNLEFDSYEALIEYEWAPIDRLGLEVELPFTVYSGTSFSNNQNILNSGLNSIKLAAQYTYYVDEERSISAAIGYIHEFELAYALNQSNTLFRGNRFNPFAVIAKRWGNNFHSLIYAGPAIEQTFRNNQWKSSIEINSNLHYMITGTRNFIGIEVNKSIDQGHWKTTLRPQMRLGIAENLLIGIVTAIPLSRESERLGTFARIIWEPKHH